MQQTVYKSVARSAVAILGALYIGFLLQTGFFPRIELGGVTPNIILIVTSMFGFLIGAKYGMLTGFLGGLILDVFSGSYFGMYALIYLYIGALDGILARVYYGDDIKLPLVITGGSDFLLGMIIYISQFLFRSRNDLGFYITNVIMPEVVYTTLVAVFLYFPLKWLCSWVDQGGERTNRGMRGNRELG